MSRIEELRKLIAEEKDETKVQELKNELALEEKKVADAKAAEEEEMRKAKEAREAELEKVREEARAEAKKAYEAEIAEAKRLAEEEANKKVEEIKNKYISEEAKREIEAEEARKAKEAKALEEAEKERKEKEEWELEKARILARGRKADIAEIADEFKIPAHLKKYIMGSTMEEMRASAKGIVDDMLQQDKNFDARVQAEVEKRFASGAEDFNKGKGGAEEGITLEKFKNMSIHEKYDLREKDYNLFSELKAKLDAERML